MMRLLDPKELKTSRVFFETKPSGAGGIFVITILVLLVGSLVWAALAPMDEIVSTTAYLRPVGTISSLRSLASGELKVKNYHQDQMVMAGDLLWEVDTQADTLDLQNSKVSLARIVQDEESTRKLLASMKAGFNILSDADSKAQVMVQAWESELRRLGLELEQAQTRLLREKQKPASLVTGQTLQVLEAQVASRQAARDSWASAQTLQATESLKTLQQNRQTYERRISDLERAIKNAVVYAPISGHLDELVKVNPGDFLVSGQEILRIIPEDSRAIKAELYVQPGDIARLEPGQKVNLRFSGLPPSDFGQLEAVISLIPADVSQSSSGTPVFVVEATLKDATLASPRGEKIRLRPGMSAEGRIILRQDTVLRMVLHKLDFLRG